MLNGQVSDWSDVRVGVPQGSILGALLVLIFINDLSEVLSSNAKLFADDTSLFSVIHDSNTSALELNSDLVKINRWLFQWKMNFNPDHKEQVQEGIFSRKSKAISHPPLVFNNNNVIQISLYRFPSHNQDHFQAFIDDLEMNLETLARRNPFLTVVIGENQTQNQKTGAAKTALVSKASLLKM